MPIDKLIIQSYHNRGGGCFELSIKFAIISVMNPTQNTDEISPNTPRVIGGTSPKRHRLSKKKTLIIIFVLLLLSTSTGIGYYVWTNMTRNAQWACTGLKDGEYSGDSTDWASQLGITNITDSNQAKCEKTQETVEKLKELAANETDTAKKSEYLDGVASIYINSNDSSAAVAAALAYEENDQSALSAQTLARAYFENQDYENAAKYYGIAAERSPQPASPTERAPYNDYKILQREAEGKIQ